MRSMIVDSLMLQKTTQQKKPGMVTNTFHSSYLIQLAYRFHKFIKTCQVGGCGELGKRSVDEKVSSGLKVALSIEGSGEGSVVQCPWWCSRTSVWWHPHDAILCLFRGEFSPQLIHKYVGLWWWKENTVQRVIFFLFFFLKLMYKL